MTACKGVAKWCMHISCEILLAKCLLEIEKWDFFLLETIMSLQFCLFCVTWLDLAEWMYDVFVPREKNPLRWRRRPFLIWEQFLFRSLQHLSKRHQMTRKKKRERRNRKKRAHELWWCKHHFTHHFPLSLLRANDLIWATATADGYALTKYREIQQIWSERKNHTQAISFFSRLCLHH